MCILFRFRFNEVNCKHELDVIDIIVLKELHLCPTIFFLESVSFMKINLISLIISFYIASTKLRVHHYLKGNSREAHALASCENLKSVRLTFFKLNRQIQNGDHWEGPRWTEEILRRIYVTHA